MRTIQVINVRWFNATAWYGLYLGKLLNDAGHETLILALPETPPWQKALEFGLSPKYLPLNTVNPLRYPPLYAKLKKVIKDFRPDVINCHRGEAFFLFGLLRQELKSFALVRTRGDQRLPKGNVSNRILHKSLTDAIIVTNTRMYNHFVQTMRIPEEKINLILGGVDRDKFKFNEEGRTRIRKEFGFDESSFVVGLVGRYDEVKGHHDLIRAAALIKNRLYSEKNINLRLLFVGYPMTHMSQEDVERVARQAGIADSVHFTGRRNDLAHCLSALDAGVVASLWSETIARAALELMSCGRPLISTTVGVMPDLLPAAAMYETGNFTELAQKLVKLASESEFEKELLADSSARISTLRGQDFLENTLEVYEKALENLK